MHLHTGIPAGGGTSTRDEARTLDQDCRLFVFNNCFFWRISYYHEKVYENVNSNVYECYQ